MSKPTTYLEWVDLLDKFGNGDDSVLRILNEGSFNIDAGTASRFYIRVEEAYKKRKNNWLERFQRSFQTYNFKNEDEFEIALRNGKQNLCILKSFVTLQCLPEDLRNTLHKDLEEFVDEIKNTLKTNASKMPHSRDRVIISINNFDLNTSSLSFNSNNIATNKPKNIFPSSGRKIIF